MVLPFWYRLTRVVPEKGPLNVCVCVCVCVKLELVDKFCYLGEMLSVDRDADAAVEARIRIGWNKFRQLVPCLPIRTCL